MTTKNRILLAKETIISSKNVILRFQLIIFYRFSKSSIFWVPRMIPKSMFQKLFCITYVAFSTLHMIYRIRYVFIQHPNSFYNISFNGYPKKCAMIVHPSLRKSFDNYVVNKLSNWRCSMLTRNYRWE